MSRRPTASTTCAASPTSTGSARAARRMWQHDMEQFARRWRAFGWHAVVIDGHDLSAILDALDEARRTKGRPTMILARHAQGQGRVVRRGQGGLARQGVQEGRGAGPRARRARDAVRAGAASGAGQSRGADSAPPASSVRARAVAPSPSSRPPTRWATRSRPARPTARALAKLGAADARVVALDADVKNSTFSDEFEKLLPERFYQNFIAEQVMVGAAMGLAARGAIPFPSTFACFLARAADFIRMAGNQQRRHQDGRVARRRVDWRGRAVADGARGPGDVRAQPNIAVLYPCDAVSTERLVALAACDARARLHPHQPAEDAGDLRQRRGVRRRRV